MDKTAVIIGASSGVGKALAYELSKLGYNLVISARDFRTLNAIKQDLEVCYKNTVFVKPLDLSDSNLKSEIFVKECLTSLQFISALFVTAGVSLDEDSGINIKSDIEKIVSINYTSIVFLLNQFSKEFVKQNNGSITIVSSIAAHAARTNNLVYASAKKGLEYYCLGLRHFLTNYNVYVNIVALGYADTALAYGKKLLFPKASPTNIAKFMIANSSKDKGLKFYPGYWRLIVGVLRILPWTIYKKMNF